MNPQLDFAQKISKKYLKLAKISKMNYEFLKPINQNLPQKLPTCI